MDKKEEMLIPIGVPKVDPRHLRRFDKKKKELQGKSEEELIKILEKMNHNDPEGAARQGPGFVAEAIVTFEEIDKRTKKRKLEIDAPPEQVTEENRKKIEEIVKNEEKLKKQRKRQNQSRRGGGNLGFSRGNPLKNPFLNPKVGQFLRNILK